MRSAATAVLVAVLGGALLGCGISDPYHDAEGAERRPTRTDVGADRGQRRDPHGDDYPLRADRPLPTDAPPGGRGADSPERAASLYARTFANWSWRDVGGRQARALAALAAGELRAAVDANARALREDSTLARERQANRGEQLAIDVQGSAPRARRVWIVLRETSSAHGLRTLADTRVTVYEASVELLEDGRWYVTAFEPR